MSLNYFDDNSYNSNPYKRTRSIPVSTAYEQNLMLNEAVMKTANRELDEHSPLQNKTKKNSMNVKLNEPVDIERINRVVNTTCDQKKLAPLKNTIKSSCPNENIALYDIRNGEGLNAQNRVGNLLPDSLANQRYTKIMTPYAWMQDYNYIENALGKEGFDSSGYYLDAQDNTGNYNGYLHHLQTDKTNIPHIYKSPMTPDDRLLRSSQTAQREFLSDAAKMEQAMNLKNSPYMKEKIQRRVESDILFKHEGKRKAPINRVNDLNLEHWYVEDQEKLKNVYQFEDRSSREITRDNSRVVNQFNNFQTRNHNVDDVDERSMNDYGIPTEYNQFDKERFHKYNDLYNQYTHSDVSNGVEEQSMNDNSIQNSYASDVEHQTVAHNYQYLSDKNPMNRMYDNSIESHVSYGNANSTLEREMTNKNDHILMVRKNGIAQTYEDINNSMTAPVLITADDNGKLIKTFVTAGNEKIYLIQKRNADDISDIDQRKNNDDFIGIALPYDSVSDSFREKAVHTKNEMNTRVVELTYDELIEVANVIDDQYDKAKRIKFNDMIRFMHRDNDVKRLNDNFENDTIFVSQVVAQLPRDVERMKNHARYHRYEQSDNSNETQMYTGESFTPNRNTTGVNINSRNKQLKSHNYSFEK